MKNAGLDFEVQLFGCHNEHWRRAPMLSFSQAVRQAEALQMSRFEWDPANPRCGIRKLFDEVKKFLPDNLKARLRVYVALGTTLDRQYKTDGFFRIEGRPGIVSFDAKSRPSKSKITSLTATVKRALRLETCIIVRSNDLKDVLRLAQKAWQIADRLQWRTRELSEPKPNGSSKNGAYSARTVLRNGAINGFARPKPGLNALRDNENLQRLRLCLS